MKNLAKLTALTLTAALALTACGSTADSAASRTTRGSLERVFFILSTCNRPDNKPRPGGKAGARNGTFNSVYMQKRVNQPFSFILAKHSLQ